MSGIYCILSDNKLLTLTVCRPVLARLFLRFMGIVNSKQIKLIVPLGNNDYYLVDAETGKNLLRPQWKDNYNQNSV
jgi:hypothetical protein